MPSTAELGLYAAGGLVAAEAIGATDVTPIGRGDDPGRGGGDGAGFPGLNLEFPQIDGGLGLGDIDGLLGQQTGAVEVPSVEGILDSIPEPDIPSLPGQGGSPWVPDVPGVVDGGGGGGGATTVPSFTEAVLGFESPDPAGWAAEQGETIASGLFGTGEAAVGGLTGTGETLFEGATGAINEAVGTPGPGAADSGGFFGTVYDMGEAAGTLVPSVEQGGTSRLDFDPTTGPGSISIGGGGGGGGGGGTESGGLFRGGLFGGSGGATTSEEKADDARNGRRVPSQSEIDTAGAWSGTVDVVNDREADRSRAAEIRRRRSS